MFDFRLGPLGASTPLRQTSDGLTTATFRAGRSGDVYAVHTGVFTRYFRDGWLGRVAGAGGEDDLRVTFDRPLTALSLHFRASASNPRVPLEA